MVSYFNAFEGEEGEGGGNYYLSDRKLDIVSRSRRLQRDEEEM